MTSAQPAETKRRSPLLRILIAVLLGLLGLAYAFAVVTGGIQEHDRIDTPTLVFLAFLGLVVLALLHPDLFSRLKTFEMSGIKLEMLERVREKQSEQALQLQDMRLMLPLLLPAGERKHLMNLAARSTKGYKTNQAMRTELRRLRSLELIRMLPDKHIAAMNPDGQVIDLANFLELTENGRRWAKRIDEIEKAEAEAMDAAAG
jgi:hypothetical protein